MTVNGFQVHRETIDDGIMIRPVGDVDLSRSPELRIELAEAQSEKPKRLIVNLADVPYMDSSGVATLVEAMQIARKRGTKLVLCCMQEKVRAIFEIARLDMVFTIVEDTEAAMAV